MRRRLLVILLAATIRACSPEIASAQSSNPTNPDPGQPAAQAPVQPSFLAAVTDPVILSAAAFDLSNVAEGTTAWKFSLGAKHYSVSPVQQTGIAAASTIAAAAIAHKWPKLKTPLSIALAAAAAYYGGKAYAQSQNHGAAQ